MMVLKSAGWSVCMCYLFLGKHMESKTQVSTGMMVQPVFTRLVGPASGKIRADIIITFRENFDLKITITTNLKPVTFIRLYIRSMHWTVLTLKRTYISVHSNHPHNIIKALPDNISQRISNISSDKATFSNAAPFYNDVLSGRAYKENLTYQQDLP